jgi:hypothetical protein
MPNFPSPLNPDETVLRGEENARHVKNNLIGYNVVYGTLWLTNQRIVFQSFPFATITAYPLSHVAAAEALDVSIHQRTGRYSSHTFNSALRISFDNGGKEYFIPANIPDWAAAILDARISAPTLAYIQTPPATSAVEQGSRGCWMMAGIFAGIVLLFICISSACILLPFALSLLSGKGS